MSRIAVVGSLLALLAIAPFVACTSAEGEGSESHFLSCKLNSDCDVGLACISGYCRRPATPFASPEPHAPGAGGAAPIEASPADAQVDAGHADASRDGAVRAHDATAPADGRVIATDAGRADARPSDGAPTPVADAGREGGSPPEGGNHTDARGDALDSGPSFLRCGVTEYPLSEAGANPYVYGITAGPDGNMWFTEFGRIGRITMQGAITYYPIPAGGASPANIVVAGDGNLWFTDPGTDAIGRITPSGVVTEFPAVTDYPYSSPYGIASGPDGNVWYSFEYSPLADVAPIPVFRMTVGGDAAGSFTMFDSSLTWGGPVAAGPDGNLWFTNPIGTPYTERIDPSGAVVGDFSGAGGPLAAGSDGNMWILTMAGYFIAKVDGKSGTLLKTYEVAPMELGVGNSGGIALGPDGNMWFSLLHSSRIGRITPSGVITECSLPSDRQPFGIARGPDGNIWFTEQGAGGYVAVLHVVDFPHGGGG